MGIREELAAQWRNGGTVKRLVLVNIAVFVVVHAIGLVGAVLGQSEAEAPVLRQLMSTNDPGLLLRKPWTVVTYMFTHYEPMHLFWNMVMLWFSGQLFRMVLQEKRLLGNYLLGGLAGLCLYLVAGLAKTTPGFGGSTMILGASASVMSILVGVATFRPNMEVNLLLVGPVRLKYVAMVFLFLDLISIRAGGNTGGHLAHLGGALYGYLAARQLLQGRDWSLRFVLALERIPNLWRGRRGARMRMERGGRNGRPLGDEEFNAAKKAKQERIDAILDKISRSGYDSLSKEERDLLFRASNDR